MKNYINQIQELVKDFDWILKEDYFTYQGCDLLLPFLVVTKPVLVIEHEIAPADFCPQPNQQGFFGLNKNRDLVAYYTDCRIYPSQ